MMRRFHYLVATGFGSGYSPTAPGTAGTILAWLAAFFLFRGDMALLISATALVTIVGTISADYVEKDNGSTDPSIVVVDEIAGMWLGMWFLPVDIIPCLIAFGLFRLFDVTKLFPINHLQNLPGGWGIVLDDIGAGIYTMMVMQLLYYFQIF